MDLQVTQENLSKALGNVARVASGRSTLPILSNVLIKTTGNRVSISATNLDIGITQFIGSKVNQKGSVTVPARLTQDFIASLPASTINLKQQDNRLHIDAGSYQSTINGAPSDDFPVMPTVKDGASISLPAQELKKSLAQVLFAASSDETRPVLTGVLLHNSNGQLILAATDSYRLAQKKVGPIKTPISLLVPASALGDLLRVISDSDKEVTITHDEQQVLFRVGDVELIARLIDGQYPDYQKLIPTTFSTTATVDKSELISISKISSLFSRENAGSITVEVDGKDKTISIQSVASQVGENHSKASAKIKGGGSITLNSRYLLDGVQAMGGETVNFCFNGKLEPIVLTSPEDKDYLHLIMPLKS